MKKNIISLMMCTILSFSLFGCELKDDYILKTNENTDELPFGEKVDDIFDSEKMTELMDKLKTTPKEVSDKIDEVDSDTERMIREASDKAAALTDALNSADFEGKSEDVKSKFEDISDKLDEIKDRVDDEKNQIDTNEEKIDKTQVSDTMDEFTSHMDNLQSALDRVGNDR